MEINGYKRGKAEEREGKSWRGNNRGAVFSNPTTDVRCGPLICGMMDGWIEEREDGWRNE